MDMRKPKEGIKRLDPELHGALIEALKNEHEAPAEKQRRHGDGGKDGNDPFFEVYKEAVDKLNTLYVIGTIKYINEHQPALSGRIKRVERMAEELWQPGVDAEATIQRFQELLTKWVQSYVKGIELYSKELSRNQCRKD